MPQYVVNLAVSADGFIADAGGGVGWLEGYDPAEMNFDAFLAGVDRMVMGAATYRQVLSFGVWPYGDVPCVVMSSGSLPMPIHPEPEAVVEFLTGGPAAVLQHLAEVEGRVWVVGGARTVAGMFEAGMHAEIELAIIPRLLGSGVRLFAEHHKPGPLQLLEARPLASGIVVLRYAMAPV